MQERVEELQREAHAADERAKRLESKCASAERALTEQTAAANAQAAALQAHFTGTHRDMQDQVRHMLLLWFWVAFLNLSISTRKLVMP